MKNGGTEGDPDIEYRSHFDQWCGDEKRRWQMEKKSGQGIEQVRQDQFFFGHLALVIGFGQHGVGGNT